MPLADCRGGLWLARHALPVPTQPASPSAPTSASTPSTPCIPCIPATLRPASAFCYGHTDWPADPALTHAAAAALARALATTHPLPTRRATGAQPCATLTVRCSPLRRCQQMAQALAALRPDVSVLTDPRLAELHFGRWEGLPWDDVPRAELDAWAGNFGTYRVGTDGETVHELLQRVAQLTLEARHTHTPDALWITHAGVIRAVHWLQGQGWPGAPAQPQASDWPAQTPGYGAWCRIAWPEAMPTHPGGPD